MRKFAFLCSIVFCLAGAAFAAEHPTQALQIQLGTNMYYADTTAFYSVGPDCDYIAVRFTRVSDGKGPIQAFLLRVDMKNPLLSTHQELAKGKVIGNETVSSMGKRLTTSATHVCFAGTNGDFFATSGDKGRPTGTTIGGSEFAYIPNDHSARRLGAVDDNQRGAIGTTAAWSGQAIVKGDTLKMKRVNYERSTDQLVLFNYHNGATTLTNEWGTEVLLEPVPGDEWHTNCKVRTIVRSKEVNKGSMAITQGHVVLSGHGKMAAALDTLQLGDTVTIAMQFTIDGVPQNISECIGGDNYALILDGGKVVESNFWNELHPRTAFGQSQQGDTLFFLVVDGRITASVGCTTQALGAILRHYGAYKGVNWDGGGSSHLWCQKLGLMNDGCETSERAVGNGMFLIADLPEEDTVVTRLEITARPLRMPRYGVIRPQVNGYNQYGMLIAPDIQDYTMTCEPAVGTINAEGAFVSNASGKVQLHRGNAVGEMEVRVEQSAQIAFPVRSILIDDKHTYLPQLKATLSGRTMGLSPQAVSWTIAQPEIVLQQEDYSLIGLKNGTTYLYARVGDYVDSMEVTVEIPEKAIQLLDSMNASATWDVSGSSKGLSASLSQSAGGGMLLTCTYGGGRNSQLRLKKEIRAFGLPSAIELHYNSDGLQCSAIRCYVTAHNATASTQIKMSPSAEKGDSVLVADLDKTFADYGDISYFPVTFNDLAFVLDNATSKKEYHIPFKGLYLIYGSDPTAVESVCVPDSYVRKCFMNGQLIIFRNGLYYLADGRVLQ